jgi:hypothetical protein
MGIPMHHAQIPFNKDPKQDTSQIKAWTVLTDVVKQVTEQRSPTL